MPSAHENYVLVFSILCCLLPELLLICIVQRFSNLYSHITYSYLIRISIFFIYSLMTKNYILFINLNSIVKILKSFLMQVPYIHFYRRLQDILLYNMITVVQLIGNRITTQFLNILYLLIKYKHIIHKFDFKRRYCLYNIL